MGVSRRTKRAGRKQRSPKMGKISGRCWAGGAGSGSQCPCNSASGLWVGDPGKASPLLSPSGPGHCLLSDRGLCHWPVQSSFQTPGSPPSQRQGRFLERKWWHMREGKTHEIHKNMTSHPVKELTLEKSFQRHDFKKNIIKIEFQTGHYYDNDGICRLRLRIHRNNVFIKFPQCHSSLFQLEGC